MRRRRAPAESLESCKSFVNVVHKFWTTATDDEMGNLLRRTHHCNMCLFILSKKNESNRFVKTWSKLIYHLGFCSVLYFQSISREQQHKGARPQSELRMASGLINEGAARIRQQIHATANNCRRERRRIAPYSTTSSLARNIFCACVFMANTK